MERKYRQPLNAYDYQPEEMKAYLRHNGWHFNKKMCEWAIKQMRKNGKPIRIMTKDDIEDILKKNNIVLENNVGYDAVYIAHMCLADFYGSSITEEKQMAQFIKDYVDDEDQQDGFIFNRFYADTSFNAMKVRRYLRDLGCSGIPLEDACNLVLEGEPNKGITYSNVDTRKTVVVIGWATSKEEYMNSLSHEMLHVVQHIS